jgi:hypothetical protein
MVIVWSGCTGWELVPELTVLATHHLDLLDLLPPKWAIIRMVQMFKLMRSLWVIDLTRMV